jgi:hypothetical protein
VGIKFIHLQSLHHLQVSGQHRGPDTLFPERIGCEVRVPSGADRDAVVSHSQSFYWADLSRPKTFFYYLEDLNPLLRALIAQSV